MQTKGQGSAAPSAGCEHREWTWFTWPGSPFINPTNSLFHRLYMRSWIYCAMNNTVDCRIRRSGLESQLLSSWVTLAKLLKPIGAQGLPLCHGDHNRYSTWTKASRLISKCRWWAPPQPRCQRKHLLMTETEILPLFRDSQRSWGPRAHEKASASFSDYCK